MREGALEALEAAGFSVTVKSPSELSSSNTFHDDFIVVSLTEESSSEQLAFLSSLSKPGPFVFAWTDENVGQAWSNLGVDYAFSGDEEEEFIQVLEFITKLLDDRAHWKEEEASHLRDQEDLNITVESLELASKRFEALFNGLPVGCFTFDSFGLIHEWNGLATELFQIEGYEAFFNPVWDVMDPDGEGVWTQEFVEKVFSTDRAAEFDWSFQRNDGTKVHLACKVLTLTNRRGEVIAAVASNLDITERVEAKQKVLEQMREINTIMKTMEKQRLKLQDANRQLRRLAVTDGLTNLTNRRRFNEMLEETLDRAIRTNNVFSILLFDIDHFKKLNDVFGHTAGDEVLVKFAKVLTKTARRYERPARFGGEEFAIILDNCDATAVRLAAERFRAAIIAEKWPYRDVTASVGCATFDGVGSPRLMLEQADQALYFSKHEGRNRVTHFLDIPADSEDLAA